MKNISFNIFNEMKRIVNSYKPQQLTNNRPTGTDFATVEKIMKRIEEKEKITVNDFSKIVTIMNLLNTDFSSQLLSLVDIQADLYTVEKIDAYKSNFDNEIYDNKISASLACMEVGIKNIQEQFIFKNYSKEEQEIITRFAEELANNQF